MPELKNTGFADRQALAAEARRQQLEQFKARPARK